MTSAVKVVYRGRVQGVGFRAEARRIASGFCVRGWVRNLPDGSVELAVEAEDGELNSFLAEIRRAMGTYVTSEMRQPLGALGPGDDFEIRFDLD